MTDALREGLIVKAQSGFFSVETGEGLIVCQLRGKLKRGRARGDIAALGDRVRITALPDGTGVIEEVLPRVRAIIRLDPRPQGVYQQVLLANPDQALFVFAFAAHPGLLDPHLLGPRELILRARGNGLLQFAHARGPFPCRDPSS